MVLDRVAKLHLEIRRTLLQDEPAERCAIFEPILKAAVETYVERRTAGEAHDEAVAGMLIAPGNRRDAAATAAPPDATAAAATAQDQEPPLEALVLNFLGMPLGIVLEFLQMRDVVRAAVVGRAWALAANSHVEQTAPAFFRVPSRRLASPPAVFSDHYVGTEGGQDFRSKFSQATGAENLTLIGRWLAPYERTSTSQPIPCERTPSRRSRKLAWSHSRKGRKRGNGC